MTVQGVRFTNEADGTEQRSDVTLELKSSATKARWSIVRRGGTGSLDLDGNAVDVDLDDAEVVSVEVLVDLDDETIMRIPLRRIDGDTYLDPPIIEGPPRPFRGVGILHQLGQGRIHAAMRDDLRGEIVPTVLPKDWSDTIRSVPRPGAPGRSDFEVAVWLERYLEALAENPRAPMEEIERRYPGMKKATLNQMKYGAVRRGLWKSAGRGKAGGSLTAKARKLLQVPADVKMEVL